MQFGQAIGTAALTFALTNIDDAFVLVTFFAESANSNTLTPLKITIGQYLGFTIIIAISLIGYGVAIVLPSEPIGFLGLLPILLGFWKLFELLQTQDEEQDVRAAGLKSVLKVSVITILNGGDNIGTYIPLFSQVKSAEIAIYVVVYYILLGVWCLVAYLIIKQKHILSLIQKYVGVLIPFLYMGLGVYIVVKSDAYPWAIERIDNSLDHHPGRAILATLTVFVLLVSIGIMTWIKVFRRRKSFPALADREADIIEHEIPDIERNINASQVINPVQQDITPDIEPKTNSSPKVINHELSAPSTRHEQGDKPVSSP
ncbi:cadmium resistance transporter-domain-containing protein [Xylaria flabelliformis]|nr:cadmium resistance transporter-domain-containing protein [Xylaria flabelliformis]